MEDGGFERRGKLERHIELESWNDHLDFDRRNGRKALTWHLSFLFWSRKIGYRTDRGYSLKNSASQSKLSSPRVVSKLHGGRTRVSRATNDVSVVRVLVLLVEHECLGVFSEEVDASFFVEEEGIHSGNVGDVDFGCLWGVQHGRQYYKAGRQTTNRANPTFRFLVTKCAAVIK